MNKLSFSQLAYITMGQSPNGEYCGINIKGVPLLNGPAEFTEFAPIPVQYTSDPKKMSKVGDILFCVRGSTTGRMNWSNQEYAIGRGLAAITHKEGKQYNHFLKYLIENYLSSLLNNTNGSTFPNLTSSLLADFIVDVPNLPIQKKISNLLANIDKKIELNNQINTELETMAKTLYDYWFVQFDFPDAEGKPYKSSGGKMIYHEVLKREIPEGWENGTFGDYSKVKSGFAFKSTWWSDEGVPVLKIKDVLENYTLNQTDFSFVPQCKVPNNSESFTSKAGDVVIAMTGATIGKFAAIPYTKKPILINQRVGLYQLGEDPFKKLPFLINSMKQDFFRLKVFQIAGGAAQPNISNEQLNSFPLNYPSDNLIGKFNERLADSYKLIATNIKQNKDIEELRDWLLPMLMNGQVTVSQ